MTAFYEWLYERYAEPRMDETLLDSTYHFMKESWLEVEEELSPDDSLRAEDYIGTLKRCWGALAFDRGVRVGFMLFSGLVEEPEE